MGKEGVHHLALITYYRPEKLALAHESWRADLAHHWLQHSGEQGLYLPGQLNRAEPVGRDSSEQGTDSTLLICHVMAWVRNICPPCPCPLPVAGERDGQGPREWENCPWPSLAENSGEQAWNLAWAAQ